MSENINNASLHKAHLVLTGAAVVVSVAGLLVQRASINNASDQLLQAQRQAQSAETQAAAAIEQANAALQLNRLSDVDRFRNHIRDDYYYEDSDSPGITTVYVRKNRQGAVGAADLMFQKETTTFLPVDRRAGEGE